MTALLRGLVLALILVAAAVFSLLVRLYEACGGRLFRDFDYLAGFQSSRLAGPHD